MEVKFIGESPRIREIKELIKTVADSALSVIISGETGVGKDIVARALHNASDRRDKKFVKVNCAALPSELLESELFGYEKGSFTGATRFKPGKFDVASGGVIFLDEIGDMPLHLQSKLLQVLQSGEFSRLGGGNVYVDNWVITATNHDLSRDMEDGKFREDLYYRLNVIKINVPSLRERKEDIPLLIDFFVDKYRKELSISEDFVIEQKTMNFLLNYDWPGNIRELSNTIQRLMVLGDWDEIKSQMFASSDNSHSSTNMPDNIAASNPSDTKIVPLKLLKADASDYIEKRLITYVLNLQGGNKTKAAKALEISYKALLYKMQNLGLR